TGFGYAARDRAVQAAVVAAVLPRVRDIRRLGSAALDLCFLAAGRDDAYYESGLHAWDYAAGGPVAAGGGRRPGRAGGAAPRGEELYAGAGPGLAPAFFALIAELTPAQRDGGPG